MFRPCIDLHEGKVKQIVGGSLSDSSAGLRTNFVSERPAEWYAQLYKRDGLTGGHIIMLGPGNEDAARKALASYSGGLQIGGGINLENAKGWLAAGASHVIVTSWLFPDNTLSWDRLKALSKAIGKERLVIDLSCRIRENRYWVVTNRWQTFTSTEVNRDILAQLASFCSEFLIHAVDVEGLCQGIDLELVKQLSAWSSIPTTYAGGARSLEDLETVHSISGGRVDLTIGSALNIFGGKTVDYQAVVEFNRRHGG